MNKNSDVYYGLISLTEDYLYSQSPQIDPKINYNKVFSVSREHNLASVVYCALRNSSGVLTEKAFNESRGFFYDYIYLYEHQKYAMQELRKIFSQNKIRFVFFKGAVIRELYPVPESRVMGDIDVLIDKKNRKKVKALLKEAGYKCLSDNGSVWNYKKNSVEIEVHTRLIRGKTGANTKAEEFYSDAINHAVFNEFEGSFEKEYCFSFLIAHIAHHFWFYGAGIRQILDLAVLIKSQSLDFKLIEKYLADSGLLKFGKNILGICTKWYALPLPYSCSNKELESFICSHGVFGGTNRNRGAVITRKALEDGRGKSALQIKFDLLFPSYEKMCQIPYIKFIDGRRYLVLWAWIYRLFYNLLHRYNFVKNAASQISEKETAEMAAKEFNFFKEIGLL